jgi:hypothetical protein
MISRPVLDAAEQVGLEMQRLLDERKKLRIDRPDWLNVTLKARLGQLREIARATEVDRHELNARLRSLLEKVIVDWPSDRLILHWKHGGQSIVPALLAPLRMVSNPRRSDRPRLGPGKAPLPLPVVER